MHNCDRIIILRCCYKMKPEFSSHSHDIYHGPWTNYEIKSRKENLRFGGGVRPPAPNHTAFLTFIYIYFAVVVVRCTQLLRVDLDGAHGAQWHRIGRRHAPVAIKKGHIPANGRQRTFYLCNFRSKKKTVRALVCTHTHNR